MKKLKRPKPRNQPKRETDFLKNVRKSLKDPSLGIKPNTVPDTVSLGIKSNSIPENKLKFLLKGKIANAKSTFQNEIILNPKLTTPNYHQQQQPIHQQQQPIHQQLHHQLKIQRKKRQKKWVASAVII